MGSHKIHEKYAGDKNVIIVEGDHNSNRPAFLYDSALMFLVQVLQVPQKWRRIILGNSIYNRFYIVKLDVIWIFLWIIILL